MDQNYNTSRKITVLITKSIINTKYAHRNNTKRMHISHEKLFIQFSYSSDTYAVTGRREARDYNSVTKVRTMVTNRREQRGKDKAQHLPLIFKQYSQVPQPWLFNHLRSRPDSSWLFFHKITKAKASNCKDKYNNTISSNTNYHLRVKQYYEVQHIPSSSSSLSFSHSNNKLPGYQSA